MNKSGQSILIEDNSITLLFSEGNDSLSVVSPVWGYLSEMLLELDQNTAYDKEGVFTFLLDQNGNYQKHILGNANYSEEAPIKGGIDDDVQVQYHTQRPIILPHLPQGLFYRKMHKKVFPDGNINFYARAQELEPADTYAAGSHTFSLELTLDVACMNGRKH